MSGCAKVVMHVFRSIAFAISFPWKHKMCEQTNANIEKARTVGANTMWFLWCAILFFSLSI